MTLVIDVLSDIQGRLHHLANALTQLEARGRADLLVLNGDLVDHGTLAEYTDLFETLDAHPHAPLVSLIGNHEFYNPSVNAESIARFLQFAGEESIWGATEVRRQLIVRLGTIDGSKREGHDVVLGDEQLSWLRATLARAPADRPVLVFSHQPLSDTCSGTQSDPPIGVWPTDYAEPDELRDILASHPAVIFLTGHTHWAVDVDDWAAWVEHGAGGFWSVNTGAIMNRYGLVDGEENVLDQNGHSGLRITVEETTITIEAIDFVTAHVVNRFVWPSR